MIQIKKKKTWLMILKLVQEMSKIDKYHKLFENHIIRSKAHFNCTYLYFTIDKCMFVYPFPQMKG